MTYISRRLAWRLRRELDLAKSFEDYLMLEHSRPIEVDTYIKRLEPIGRRFAQLDRDWPAGQK